MKNLYFVDFENLQHLDYTNINAEHDQVVIFTGANQTKISLDIVCQIQPLGQAIKWIKMEGAGRNALDFHIAFYLGYFIALEKQLNKKTSIYVISKDCDYDQLIRHIQSSGYECERRQTFSGAKDVCYSKPVGNIIEQASKPINATASELTPPKDTLEKTLSPQLVKEKTLVELNYTEIYTDLIEKLKKIDKLKRPRTQDTLSNLITSNYKNKKKDLNSSKVFNLLIANKKIKVTNKRISYLF
ncbi:MAG: hypothetical protein RL571_884 [Pseudomonadota bacterium]|jgi:hypothetical protein